MDSKEKYTAEDGGKNDFELIPAKIFKAEREASQSHKLYSDEEKKAFHTMAQSIEDHCWDNIEEYTEELLPLDLDELSTQENLYLDLKENFDKKGGMFPPFFCLNRWIFYYDSIRSYRVDFEDTDVYSLFLGFKLRNLSLHGVKEWLDNLLLKHGINFCEFLEVHLQQFSYMYETSYLNFLKNWNAKAKQDADRPPRVSPDPTLQEEQAQTNSPSFTNAQWVFLVYFFFKAYKLEIRTDIDIAPVAKFIQLITGKKPIVPENSDIYKMLGKAPSIHLSKEKNISDMELIKKKFESYGLKKAIPEIDFAIKQEKNFEKL